MSIQGILIAFLFGTLALTGSPAATDAHAAVRILLPQAPFAQASDRELAGLVEEYNQLHASHDPNEYRVEILRRGENFSSLKELVAAHLAGDLPELAAVEASELPALLRMNLAKPIRVNGLGGKASDSLPFRVTVPVLVADQEMLFRAHADPDRLPGTWSGLTRLAELLGSTQRDADENAIRGAEASAKENASQRSVLALPLQGPLGLWIFEALSDLPLWTRGASGIQNNRELEPVITQLQKLIDRPGVLQPEENWERALRSFIDRKSPLLVTSIDVLPYLSKQTPFRWTAAPLPCFGKGISRLEGGSRLLVTRDSPGVKAFLNYLYSSRNTARWLATGAYLPLSPAWLNDPAWKKALASQPAYRKLISKFAKLRPRTTDPDVVRAHSEWIQALRLFFAEASRRLPAEAVLTQMDGHLTGR